MFMFEKASNKYYMYLPLDVSNYEISQRLNSSSYPGIVKHDALIGHNNYNVSHL